jgi:predicted nucleotidyltransferase
MTITKHERSVLQNLVRTLKSDIAAKQVVLYGSAARGTLETESDIDLLVVLPFVDWEVEKRVGGLAFEAGLEIDRVISTLCFSEDDMQQSFRQASPLLNNIRREGVAL